MPFFIFSLLLDLGVRTVRIARRSKRKAVQEPLCTKLLMHMYSMPRMDGEGSPVSLAVLCSG